MRCINCGREIPDGTRFCTFCGTRQTQQTQVQVQPQQQPQPQQQSQVYGNVAYAPQQTYQQPPLRQLQTPAQENVGRGVLGALLLSLAGIAMYIGIYQLGYIIFASGIIMFNFCLFGYNKFSHANSNLAYSKKGVLICGIITLFGMILAEYIALGIEILKAGYGMTFWKSLASVPVLLSDSDNLWSALGDIAISFIVFIAFFFMTLFGSKERRKKAAAVRNPGYPAQGYQPPQGYQPQQNYQNSQQIPQNGQTGYYQNQQSGQFAQNTQGYYQQPQQVPYQQPQQYPGNIQYPQNRNGDGTQGPSQNS